jgi:4-hydroxybenzoyl-CoA reductase subunit beta
MILPELDVRTPISICEALQMTAEFPEAKLLAGGTDLLVLLKQRLIATGPLIDLGQLQELKAVNMVGEELIIGAGVTLSEVCENMLIRQRFPALSEAANSAASPNLRNMGTIGGNLCLSPRCLYYNQSRFWRSTLGSCRKTGGDQCFAVAGSLHCHACSSADCPPALIALGARVSVARWHEGNVEERIIPVEDLYRDDGQQPLTLATGELVTAIHLPLREGLRSTYGKYRRRAAIDFPLAGVAVSFTFGRRRFENIRIVLGALASAPVLALETMALLEGREFDGKKMEDAAKKVTRGTHPVKNQPGSPEHRRHMARILFRRMVEKLMDQ